MKLNFNPATQNPFFNAYRINQSAVAKNRKAGGALTDEGRKDLAVISPQGKRGSLMESLMKQKMSILEQKDSLISSAKKSGKSMESIQSQLDAYENQLKDIDEQISQAMAKEMEKQAGKAKKDDEPKTEQDIENERLANVMDLSQGLKKAETVRSVKTKVDGEARVLKSEIALDQMHDPSADTSKEQIHAKEDQLADLEQRSNKLLSDIGEIIGEKVEKADEQNDTAAVKKEDVEDAAESEKAEDGEENHGF